MKMVLGVDLPVQHPIIPPPIMTIFCTDSGAAIVRWVVEVQKLEEDFSSCGYG